MVLIVLVALAVVGCTGGDDSNSDGTDPPSKEIAPMFEVRTVDGDFSLSEHLADDGRPVFLNLWASWCYPCRQEMPAIDAASKNHPEVAFIGVSVQDPSRDDALAFANEIGVTYPLGFDDDGSVDAAYAPLGLPASFIISSEGVILERIFGELTEAELDEKFTEHFG